jgi:hypothetical protein
MSVSHIFFLASYDVPNRFGFLQGEYPSLGFPREERAPHF